MDYEDQIFLRYKNLSPCLNERSLRLFAASEALAAGTGGITLVH
ncbi:MAG: ISAzo13 family transposase, partial [Deltaproteobacteria bacterium]|nr:ISAzo13 family transposase [Deltaproteobacteria bacterium]